MIFEGKKIAILSAGIVSSLIMIFILPLLILALLLCCIFTDSFGGGTNYGAAGPVSIEYGTSYNNEIDMSAFVDPDTKNNQDLAAFAIQAWENNWGYVWGTIGGVLTESVLASRLQQYPDNVGIYEDFIRANWLGRRTADCIGLVKSYGWLDADSGTIKYNTNGMPDYGADQMFQAAKNAGRDYGTIDTIPETPGLVLWMPGHAGIYVGGGYAVEAMGTKYGVVRTDLAGRGWRAWYELPYISYLDSD